VSSTLATAGPTLDQQLAAALPVLFTVRRDQTWIQAAAATIAVQRYQQRLRYPLEQADGRAWMRIVDGVVDADDHLSGGPVR
jgi:hypothetical protein